MDIIHVPNEFLRKKSHVVKAVTPEILQFITDLSDTLEQKRNPRGVGLSAPQVNDTHAIFVTLLPRNDDEKSPSIMRTFINPQIVKTSQAKTFGNNPKEPILEGCLSIPSLYGPVPRFEWVEFEYQTIEDGKLMNETDRFTDFTARVMQHEFDHLQGKLFTDYILEFDLPLYDDTSGKLEEIDRKIAEKF